MKTNEFNDVSLIQFIFFISQVQIGIGIITLPSDLAGVAGSDGWISILLGWVLANLGGLLILQIMKRHPNESVFDLLFRYLGKWLGFLSSCLFILYCLFVFLITLFSAIHVTQTWILPQTPNYLLMMLFILPKFMLGRHGIRMLGRYAEVVGMGMIVMLPLFLMAMREGHWVHLLPVLKEGWLPIFHGAKTTILSFLGFELTFILYPYLNNKKRAAHGLIAANTITMLVYLLVTIACYVQFNPYQIPTYIWPTLDLFETIEFPFIERIEVVFAAFYLFLISTTGIPYFFTSAYGISQLLGKQSHAKVIQMLAIGYVLLSLLYNPSFYHVSAIQKWGSEIGIYVAYLFPLCFWLYMVTFGRSQVRLNQ